MNRLENSRNGSKAINAVKEERLVIFTVTIAGENFGVPIDFVRTVFHATAITPVPRAPKRILGLVNLRGHIVTVICLRDILDLEQEPRRGGLMVALEYRGEGFALAVDAVGDVLEASTADRIELPLSVSEKRRQATAVVIRTLDSVIPVLDIDSLVDGQPRTRAA